MRQSTRRSISRAVVLGLLATTPLIGGWAAAGSTDDPAARAPDVRVPDVRVADGGVPDVRVPDVVPDVRGPADVVPDQAAGGGLSADDLAAIDTSEVSVDVIGEQEPAAYVAADGESVTVDRVRAFLDGRNAPMAEQAEAIVEAGITHDVDPRVVVGIAIAESNAGERLPEGSHNAWGWGGSGKFGLAHWASWDEALDTYTERLGALYDTDDVDRSFAETYCPPNWQWWLDTVTWVIDEI